MDAILAALEALSDQKNAQAAPSAPPPQRPLPPAAAAPVRVAPPTPPPAPAPAPAPPAARSAPAAQPQTNFLQGMFKDGNSLLQAVIAAEVLGPPIALKEHHFWSQQPNEPST